MTLNKQFQKNEYVMYRNTGVCLIEDIREMSFAGQRKNTPYYILKPVSSESSSVLVPTDNEALTAKMRYLMTREEINSLLASLKDKKPDWIADRNQRSERCRIVMQEGSQRELLLMLSCIYLKKQELLKAGKKLSATDSGFVKAAEKLVSEEFCFSLGLPEGEVGKYIRARLNISEKDVL